MVGAASGRVDEIDKVIAEYRNQIYQLQKHNKEIEQGIDVAALTTDFSGGSGRTGKKEKTDYASQLSDARVKAQQTTEKLRLQIMMEGLAKRKALARQEYDEQLADIDKQERDTIAKWIRHESKVTISHRASIMLSDRKRRNSEFWHSSYTTTSCYR